MQQKKTKMEILKSLKKVKNCLIAWFFLSSKEKLSLIRNLEIKIMWNKNLLVADNWTDFQVEIYQLSKTEHFSLINDRKNFLMTIF